MKLDKAGTTPTRVILSHVPLDDYISAVRCAKRFLMYEDFEDNGERLFEFANDTMFSVTRNKNSITVRKVY